MHVNITSKSLENSGGFLSPLSSDLQSYVFSFCLFLFFGGINLFFSY